MRWRRGEVSENVEDRRGQSPMRFPGFPGARLPSGGGLRLGGGMGGFLLLLLLLWVFSGDLFSPGAAVPPGGVEMPTGRFEAPGPVSSAPAEDELVQFVSFVLDDVQRTWGERFEGYRVAKLVLYRDAIPSACGFGQAAMGPFYCPLDEKVYVDLAFYEDLQNRFGAPGDFAQAYVLAHEIGHHVQRLAGVEPAVRRARERDPRRANELSVALELQADCLAGVWGHQAARRGILEEGDAEEGLRAAAAVGDDRIQHMSRQRVSPESFTHGSSRERMEWFGRGFRSGDPDDCDAFEQGVPGF